jgi:diaminohydroxyphosphoribosylaminopyrimidine deaminase / 5-amino-6-(5-phosphoribosylamino)uracil reductase
MGQPTSAAPAQPHDRNPHPDPGWTIVLAAARESERLSSTGERSVFAVGDDGAVRAVAADDRAASIAWDADGGWRPLVAADDPRRAILELYLPICSGTAAHPVTVGHLGQSLDGFIATHRGESQWVTGEQNVRHLHRLRAVCHAVIVGAGTIAADDPQLTTRLVAGPNPLRVVLDPARRLDAAHRVFADDASETLYVCAASTVRGDRRHGRASIVGVEDDRDGGVDLAALLRLLHARGCTRVFVEGGGVTVSTFLERRQLDRLHIAIAPLFIGEGRPAIRLPPRVALGDCLRPRYRVFRMGGDMLYDCDLSADAADGPAAARDPAPPVVRVI